MSTIKERERFTFWLCLFLVLGLLAIVFIPEDKPEDRSETPEAIIKDPVTHEYPTIRAIEQRPAYEVFCYEGKTYISGDYKDGYFIGRAYTSEDRSLLCDTED